MKRVAKVRLRELKGSGYTCPVCKEGELIEIKSEKNFGNINIKFKTQDKIGFEFSCDIKNNYFFLCKNERCRARFERTSWRKGEKKVGPPCPTGKCEGSLNTYKNVPVAKVHPKKDADKVVLIVGKNEPLYFKIISGQLSYDEAGICTKCHVVGPKEIDLR
ncbi:MAG: hypothetical protein JSW00_12465 [Thermoplasmata archaeon]|nr:MAG: hypothetical protein JSW00_12465 [Thermoplasmata archaeon]